MTSFNARLPMTSPSSCYPRRAFLPLSVVLAVLGGSVEGTALAQANPSQTSKSSPKAEGKPKATTNEAPSATAPEAKSSEAKPADEKELDTRAESAKAIFFSGDLAFTRSDLGGVSDSTGFERTVANGLLYGLSTGLRLKDTRFGARWRVYDTTEFTLWTIALSAGYSLPLRPVTPIFSAHLGYVFDQKVRPSLFRSSLPPETIIEPDVDVKGLLAGFDVNASYWVTQFFRLGAYIGADLMFLSRERANLPRSNFPYPRETLSNSLYTDSGSSIGLNVNVGIRGAFDIGFK
jgi:hypothetical protein